MPDQRTAAEIDDAAAIWVAKAERGLTPEEQASLDQWLDASSRHLGAFVRAQAAWIHAERATALGAMPDAAPEEHVSDLAHQETVERGAVADRGGVDRRRLLAGGGALAASIAAGFFLFDHSRVIESGVGEVRRLALAGGTTLTLDTATRVEIEKGSDDRKLTLVQGRLFLDVPGGDPRSLILESGGLIMETIQGAFALQSLIDAPLVALVTKGNLLVSQDGFFRKGPALTLKSGHVLTRPVNSELAYDQIARLDDKRRDQLLAWRDGMLAFGGETLAEAVRAFDRYGTMRIVIADPELARQTVTGLFKADDPKGFAEAVGASFGATAVQEGNIIRLLKRNASGA